MRRLSVFMVGVMVLSLFGSLNLVMAQGDGVPLPADAGDAYVLFPGVVQDGVLGTEPQQRYIVLANAGDVISLSVQMSEPGLVGSVKLSDANGELVAESVPDPAVPTAVLLESEVTADGWYLVTVELAADPTDTSSYTLALSGSTSDIFEVFEAGEPPVVANAHLVVASTEVDGVLADQPVSYLIPAAANSTVTVEAAGESQPSLAITPYENGQPAQMVAVEAQAGVAASYTFTNSVAQWIQVDVEPAQPGAYVLTVTHPRVSGMAQDMIAAGGSASGEQCGGIEARFAEGDVIVVSGMGDDLQVFTDYDTTKAQTIGLALPGDLLDVLAPPVCYSSPGYKQDIWFWNVYSRKHDANGWVADGLQDQRWICPEDDPACDVIAECPSTPAPFAIGDTVIVSQTGDDLRITRAPGVDRVVLALASKTDQLEVRGGPACYYSAYWQSALRYWQVFSPTDNTEGWVIEAVPNQIWLCPSSDPTCDQ